MNPNTAVDPAPDTAAGPKPPTPQTSGALSYVLKLLAGPIAFVAVLLIPVEGLSQGAMVASATFAWAIVWYVLTPVPWAITSFMPLIIFPALGMLTINETTALYGQNIFFWLLGTLMLGYAIEKHGLAKRIALTLLGFRNVADDTKALLAMYMVLCAVLSTFIADVAVIALMIPVGMSIFAFVSQVTGLDSKSRLASFFAMGTLYAAVAGGTATIAGLPHNALGVALAESLAGLRISWFGWMKLGLPISVTMLVAFYILLRIVFPPEISRIPGGKEFIREEKKKLGPMKVGEYNCLVAILVMALLFMVPPLIIMYLGIEHSFSQYLLVAIPPWVVPPILLLFLFLLPVDVKKGEGTLVWGDVVHHAPWNVIFLVTGAVAMTQAMTDFGFVAYMQLRLSEASWGAVGLPFIVAPMVALATNVFSGSAATAIFCSIFVPLAPQLGFNQANMAILIPNMAVGMIFPWAGATAGTVFASGYIDMKTMIRVGLMAEVIVLVVVATFHVFLTA